MSFFKSAFEKYSSTHLLSISQATADTAIALSSEGVLFGIFVDMNNHLAQIAKNTDPKTKTTTRNGGIGGSLFSKKTTISVSDKDAKNATVLGKGMQGIGKGIQLIVDALNGLPDAKGAQEKLNVITNGINLLGKFGKSILMFAGMLALSLPLLIIGFPALLLAVPMVLLTAGLFYLLGAMGIDEKVGAVSKSLMLAGLSFVVLAGAFVLTGMILMAGNKLFSEDAKNENSLGYTGVVGAIIGLVLGTAIVFAIAGKMAMNILKGALAIGVSGIALIIMAYSVEMFVKAIPPTSDGWESIGQIAAFVTGLGVLMSAAGAAAVFIIPGAAAIAVSGLALIAVAEGIEAMSAVMKPSMFAKDGIFADSGNATKGLSVMGVTLIEGGRPMSNLEWSLLSIGRAFMLPPAAIAGMYAGAPAMMMSGRALTEIAKGLESFQGLKIDYGILPGQIAKATTVLGTAFGEIGEKYPGGGGSFLQALTGGTEGTSAVHQGISAVGGMGQALAGIASGVQNMAMLKFPSKWDKNGNPIEFKSITDDDLDNVGTNIQKIIISLSKTFGEIGNDPNAKDDWGWFGHSVIEEGISLVQGMASPLVNLATFVKEFTQEKLDVDAVTLKTQDMIVALSGTMATLGNKPDAKTAWGWLGDSAMENGIKVVDKMGSPLMKLAEFVKTFANKELDTDGVTEKTKAMIGALSGAFGEEGKMMSADDAEDYADAFGDMADSAGDMAEYMGDWKDNINDLDLEKVTEVRKLYEGLASITNGDNAIDSMGDKMVEAIELLVEKLGEFAGDIKSSNSPTFVEKAKGLVSTALGGTPATKATTAPAAKTTSVGNVSTGSTELADAIKNLQRIMQGTLNVKVVGNGQISSTSS